MTPTLTPLHILFMFGEDSPKASALETHMNKVQATFILDHLSSMLSNSVIWLGGQLSCPWSKENVGLQPWGAGSVSDCRPSSLTTRSKDVDSINSARLSQESPLPLYCPLRTGRELAGVWLLLVVRMIKLLSLTQGLCLLSAFVTSHEHALLASKKTKCKALHRFNNSQTKLLWIHY